MLRRRAAVLIPILGLALFAMPVEAAPSATPPDSRAYPASAAARNPDSRAYPASAAKAAKFRPADVNHPRGLISRAGKQGSVGTASGVCGGCNPPLLFTQGDPVMGGLEGAPGHVLLIPLYWAPAGYSFTASYRSIINGYVTNLGLDAGKPTNVFSVATQYYQQPLGAGAQIQHIQNAISAGNEHDDTDPYPAQVCTPSPGFTACVTDSQVQSELSAYTSAGHYVVNDSVLYMLLLPQGVESCISPGTCSTNAYCAYHSAFGPPYLIYTMQPYPDVAHCGDAFNSVQQAPNGDVYADTQVSMISHEANEAITDWTGAWVDSTRNYENGDMCAHFYGTPLGSTGGAGTSYNQVIGTGTYWTQEEFSNEDYALGIGDTATNGTKVPGCVPSEELPVAAFTYSPSPVYAGHTISFDASASSDTDGAVSTDPAHASPLVYSWNWGDGSILGSGKTATHVFYPAGTYTVTLTVIDLDGWRKSTYQVLNAVAGPPVVAAVSPPNGPTSGGTTVAVYGYAFTGATSVTFGGVPGQILPGVTDTAIMVTSPANPAGLVDVRVTTPLGTSDVSMADHYTYTLFTGYFSWFDNVSPGMVSDNFHLLDTGTSAAHVTLGLPGVSQINVTLQPGVEQYVTFPAGTMGGPVTVTSDQPLRASQRVQYYFSFNEVWAMDPSQASQTSYLSWFDKASTGMVADNIHVSNPGSTMANVTVSLGTNSVGLTVPAGQERYATFPTGTIGGPVKIASNQPVLASQRVQYYQSFNEVAARGPAQAQTGSMFNWYDTATPGMVGDNIHIVNPGASTATVWIGFPSGRQQVTVAPGAEVYATTSGFGVIGGPVTVSSNVPVLASQRVQYYQSFNEVASESESQAVIGTSHIMWFDKASAGMTNDNIHLYCWPGGFTCNVQVSVPGAQTISVQVASSSEAYVTFPAGTIGGPVTITSDNELIAAQRVQFYQSFNEVPGA